MGTKFNNQIVDQLTGNC